MNESSRIRNFSAGPSALPLSVLKKAQAEFLNYQGIGASVMEISHRSGDFIKILESAKTRVREIGKIPDSHEILFIQGGSRFQFAMIALNFIREGAPPALIDSGHWTQAALKELQRVSEVSVVASTKDSGYTKLPTVKLSDSLSENSFLYSCSNNTIYGTQFEEIPLSTKTPVIVDMCSDIFSRPRPFEKIDMCFASSQKNLGPPGVAMIVIRKDFAENASDKIPQYLQYRSHIEQNSLYNTAPTFSIYMLDLVLEWIQDIGGLEAMHERNSKKAKELYSAIEESDHFYSPVEKSSRSLMNVVFRAHKESDEQNFLKLAEKSGFLGLKGHRAAGGLRASLYNAVEPEWVSDLCKLIKNFKG